MKKLTPGPKGYILAIGEATGHSHRIVTDTIELFEDKDTKKMNVLIESDVIHEEHDTFTLAPEADLTVRLVEEYDWVEKKSREIND